MSGVLLMLLFVIGPFTVWAWQYGHATFERLDADNRMLRAGFGKNKGRWFLRFDFWFFFVRYA